MTVRLDGARNTFSCSRVRLIYTIRFSDPDCSGSVSTSVPGGGPILGAGPVSTVGLSTRK